MSLKKLLAIFGFFFAVSSALAETEPATPNNIPPSYRYQTGQLVTDDTQAICDAVQVSSGMRGPATASVRESDKYLMCSMFWANGTTPYDTGYTYAPLPYCPSGTLVNGSCGVSYTCRDSSWTLSGQTCTRPDCDLGYDRNAEGQCVKDCTGKAGMGTTNAAYRFTGGTSTWSVSGCKVRCDVRVLTAYGGSGEKCTYTGASALPDDPSAEPLPPDPEKLPPEDPKDCLGQGQGYIQTSTGVKCVPSENAPEGQKPDSVESDKSKESGTPGQDGKPDPNAGDYKREDSTTTRNSDGSTTTTKKETLKGTPDGNGGITCPDGFTANGANCEKVTSTKQSTSDFCSENPKDPTCKGTQPSECDEYPDRLSCMDSGDAPEEGLLPESSVGPSMISPVNVGGGGSCPQGPPLPYGLGNMSFDGLCQLATGIRPIVLAMAWLSAGLILLGGFKEG
ncbi:MAG: virulence factor TspB C-terminal domain-related protein [Rhodocyclaceae bacterium]|nr:virulence factor TspB C-terminal domain-related protein [Rhodocyclaceae bacterium]